MKGKSIVTCRCRIYNIYSPGDSLIEVGTMSPLKGRTPEELFEEFLKEYKEVESFFDKFKLLNYNGQNNGKMAVILPRKKGEHTDSNIDIPLVKPEDVVEGLDESHAEIGTSQKEEAGRKSKRDIPTIAVVRLNNMIRMKNEFTRADYQSSLKDKGFHISKYVGYDDISRALALRRIKRVGRKKGKGESITYKVINDKAVVQQEYQKMMQRIQRRKKQ